MAFFNFGSKNKEKDSTLREETVGIFSRIANVLESFKLNAEALYMKHSAEKIMKNETHNEEKALKHEEYNYAHIRAIHPIVKADESEFNKYKNNAEDIAKAEKRAKRLIKDIETIEKKQEDFNKIVAHMCTHPNNIDSIDLGNAVKQYFDKERECLIIINEETCKRNNSMSETNPYAKPTGIGVAVYDLNTNCTMIYSSVEDFGKKNLKYQDIFRKEAIEKKAEDGHSFDMSDARYDSSLGAVNFINKFSEKSISTLNETTKNYFGINNDEEIRSLPKKHIVESFISNSNMMIDAYITPLKAELKREETRIDNGIMYYVSELVKEYNQSNNSNSQNLSMSWDSNSQTVTIKSPSINEEGKILMNGDKPVTTELILSYTNKGIQSVHYISENSADNPIKVYDINDKSKGLLELNNISYLYACQNGLALERFFNLEGKSVNNSKTENKYYMNANKRQIDETIYSQSRLGKYDVINPTYSFANDADKVQAHMQKELEKYKNAVGKTMSVTYNPYNNSINIENKNSVLTLMYDKQDNIPIGLYFTEDKTEKFNAKRNTIGFENEVHNAKLMLNENFGEIGNYIDISSKAISEGKIGEIKSRNRNIDFNLEK